MKFEIKRQDRFLKPFNRLYILTDNPKNNTHIDIFDNEIKELQEVINLYCEMFGDINK